MIIVDPYTIGRMLWDKVADYPFDNTDDIIQAIKDDAINKRLGYVPVRNPKWRTPKWIVKADLLPHDGTDRLGDHMKSSIMYVLFNIVLAPEAHIEIDGRDVQLHMDEGDEVMWKLKYL